MSAAYFHAAVPEPFQILGLTLRPLSLGRYRLLRRFECNFVADEATSAGFGDLLIGVLICSMRCDEFLIWASSKHFARDVRRWSKRVCARVWLSRIPGLGKWWRRHYSFDAAAKAELFKRYIAAHSEVPKFWDETGGDAVSGAHWSQSIEVALRSELGWTWEEIAEQPLSKAIADYFKFLEGKKAIRLMTDYELALIEAAEANSADQVVGATP